MFIPDEIAACMNALEAAGFQAFVVGGCVRDSLLGRVPHDYDICTDALPEQTRRVFADHKLRLEGMQHGTVTVETGLGQVEITTYRREGRYLDSRHPETVEFVTDIREDLRRRDFTANAIAYSPSRGYADPFGGREDLKENLLRAVGDPETRFREDALRILRGIRFAVRFRMELDAATEQAMQNCAPLLQNLSGERIFEELTGFLLKAKAEDIIAFAPILCAAIPELAPMVDFDQRSPHHAYDLYTHVACVVGNVPADPVLRWAALLHDLGKVPTFKTDETGRGHFKGHAPVGAKMADAVLRRLHVPNAFREEAVTLIDRHMTYLFPIKADLCRSWNALGEDTLYRLLALQEADMISKGTGEDAGNDRYVRTRSCLSQIAAQGGPVTLKTLAISGSDLIALGIRGREVGQLLNALLDAVLEERMPNEKTVLLAAAREFTESIGISR